MEGTCMQPDPDQRPLRRPAGNFVLRDGRLWRPVQDCQHRYGARVGLAEVTRLDEKGFEQIVRTTIGPGKEWPGRRLHTLNREGSLETIDGSAYSMRFRSWLLRRPSTTK